VGKRGPKALPADKKKSVAVGLRITPALRERLDEARRAGPVQHSLGQEIEARLHQSFETEERLEEWVVAKFHDRRTYFLAEIIDDAIGDYIKKFSDESVWENAYAFDELKAFLKVLLSHLRPKGRGAVPKHMQELGFPKKGDLGEFIATLLLNAHIDRAKDIVTGPSTPQVDRRTFKRYPNINTQIRRSGRDPSKLYPQNRRPEDKQ